MLWLLFQPPGYPGARPKSNKRLRIETEPVQHLLNQSIEENISQPEPETTNVNTMFSRFMSQPSHPHQPSQPSQQKKPGRFACDLCEKDYSRSSDLKRHKNQKHGNISQNVNNSQPHSTTSQPQSTTSQPFSTTVNLVNKKMKTKCKDPVCNKTFTRNSDILRHYKNFHFIE